MKIHHRIPCSLNKVSFKINIPDSDELQIRIVGKLVCSFYLFIHQCLLINYSVFIFLKGMALALKESDREMESMSTSCSSVSER